jgi:hypothetical protein
MPSSNRATKAETNRRIHRIADLIARGVTDRKLVDYAIQEFGIARCRAAVIIRKARELVEEDYSCERPEFVARRLSITDLAIQKAMADKRYGTVAQLIRLQAELVGVLGRNSVSGWQDGNKPTGGFQ